MNKDTLEYPYIHCFKSAGKVVLFYDRPTCDYNRLGSEEVFFVLDINGNLIESN